MIKEFEVTTMKISFPGKAVPWTQSDLHEAVRMFDKAVVERFENFNSDLRLGVCFGDRDPVQFLIKYPENEGRLPALYREVGQTLRRELGSTPLALLSVCVSLSDVPSENGRENRHVEIFHLIGEHYGLRAYVIDYPMPLVLTEEEEVVLRLNTLGRAESMKDEGFRSDIGLQVLGPVKSVSKHKKTGINP